MQATKMNAGQIGFVVKNNAIAKVTVNETGADQKPGAEETTQNICDDGGTYSDGQIGATPQEIADILVSDYNAANPATEEV